MGGAFGTIVKLLILTGQRRTEIGSLKWDYIESDRIRLPAITTKNGREHSIPLTPLTADIISSVVKVSPILFPASSPSENTAFSAWSKSHSALRKLSGTSGWTLHDLRRTFATGLAKLGMPTHVTEKLLNHVSGVAGIYNRFDYWDEQVAALMQWEAHVISVVEAHPRT